MTGSELARRLIGRGDRVIGFDNFFASSIDTVSDIIESELFTFHQWDLNNISQMSELATEVKATRTPGMRLVYINCAAVVHTEHFYRVEDTFTTNVVSMRNFLHQAVELKANAFINCSTSEVYSMQSWNEQGGVREDECLTLATAEHSQRTSYAVGKLMTEFFTKDATDKGLLRACSIRFANVYSRHERFAKHIIPHIIDQLLAGSDVTLLENSKKNRRTFLHNIDSCNAVLALCDTPDALDGSVYNVATDEEITIVELTRLIAKKMNLPEPNIIFEGYRASDPERRLLNTDKIRTRTNWKPSVTLSQGLDMCVKSIEK